MQRVHLHDTGMREHHLADARDGQARGRGIEENETGIAHEPERADDEDGDDEEARERVDDR